VEDLITIARAQIKKMKTGELECSASLFRELVLFLKIAAQAIEKEEMMQAPAEQMDAMAASLPDDLRFNTPLK
jgi:hypothetical protein